MYVLSAYINKSIFEKILSGIEKVLTAFSISDKNFSKMNLLMTLFGYRVFTGPVLPIGMAKLVESADQVWF